MAMPKGFKSENGYGTSKLFDGLTYHEIADTMRESGYKMNHSTVRNIINRSFFKLAKNISDNYSLDYDAKKIDSISKTPGFQESIVDLLREKELWKKII